MPWTTKPEPKRQGNYCADCGAQLEKTDNGEKYCPDCDTPEGRVRCPACGEILDSVDIALRATVDLATGQMSNVALPEEDILCASCGEPLGCDGLSYDDVACITAAVKRRTGFKV